MTRAIAAPHAAHDAADAAYAAPAKSASASSYRNRNAPVALSSKSIGIAVVLAIIVIGMILVAALSHY